MAKAKLNNQHSYMTVKVEWANKARVNMTSSYSGSKISAAGVDGALLKRLFKAFNHMLDKQVGEGGFKNFGEAMEHLRKMGEQSSSPEALAAALEGRMGAPAAKKVEPKLVEAIVIAPPPAKGSGRDYTQAELQAAFDKVKNQKDWKARIDRTIDVKDLNVVMAAIVHFTGTVAQEYTHPNPNKVIVRAKGYRAGPCN